MPETRNCQYVQVHGRVSKGSLSLRRLRFHTCWSK